MPSDTTIEVATIPVPAMQIEVLLALPERAWSVTLSLPEGATVAEALEHALPRFPKLQEVEWSYGIYGRLVTPATLLREGDRIELLRPLLADPMDQRRRRAAQR